MTETDDISTLLVEFGRIIEKIDHITTDVDDRVLMKAHRFIAQHATALTDQAAQIERLKAEGEEAHRALALAGKMLSTLDRTLEEMCARAATAERERDEARAEVERKDAALLRIAERCRRPDLVARAALTKGGENGDA